MMVDVNVLVWIFNYIFIYLMFFERGLYFLGGMFTLINSILIIEFNDSPMGTLIILIAVVISVATMIKSIIDVIENRGSIGF